VKTSGDRLLGAVGIASLVAAALVVPAVAIDQSKASHGVKLAAEALNWATWGVFALEIAVAMIVVHDRRAWLRRHLLDVVVVIVTPPVLPASLQTLRLIRLMRLLRLIAMARYVRRSFGLQGLQAAAFFALLTILGGGTAFAAAEGRHLSIWDGMWWAIETMSTVGYGDQYPHTTLGRIVAMGVMLVGIGFVAVLTAALAEHFLAARAKAQLEELGELEVAEHHLVTEVQDIAKRVQELETMIRQFTRQQAPGG